MVGPEVCWRPFPETGEGAVCSPGHAMTQVYAKWRHLLSR